MVVLFKLMQREMAADGNERVGTTYIVFTINSLIVTI